MKFGLAAASAKASRVWGGVAIHFTALLVNHMFLGVLMAPGGV